MDSLRFGPVRTCASFFAVAIVGLGSSGCADDDRSTLQFAGTYHEYVNARIEGVMESATTSELAVKAEVKNLIYYMQGQLASGSGGSMQMHQAEVDVVVGEPVDGVVPVQYVVNVPAAVRKGTSGQMSQLILPKHGDARRFDFESTYASCSHSPFWYYYQPSVSCGLDLNALPADAAAATISHELRTDNTVGKHPEYERIWLDKTLDVTYVAGNYQESTPVDYALSGVRALYGEPTIQETVVNDGWTLSTSSFATPAGTVRMHGFYFNSGSFQRAPSDFVSAFQQAQRASDLVIYNGHAGLGANVRAFQRASLFERGRYYLFVVNACQPFAYLDPMFYERISAANGGDTWGQHVDLVSSVRIGSFSAGSDVVALVKTMVEREADYETLLLDVPGMSAVIGEEDNPF